MSKLLWLKYTELILAPTSFEQIGHGYQFRQLGKNTSECELTYCAITKSARTKEDVHIQVPIKLFCIATVRKKG